jgi:hypothetical protein
MGGEKAIVTVTEMARMVGLSRARLYQLLRAGIFPEPVYAQGRPVYPQEVQVVCLEVRRKDCGVNGQPVLFYARRPVRQQHRAKTPAGKGADIAALLEGVNALGLTTATAARVEQVTHELFPQGPVGLDRAEVLKAVFLHLRRQNAGENRGEDVP